MNEKRRHRGTASLVSTGAVSAETWYDMRQLSETTEITRLTSSTWEARARPYSGSGMATLASGKWRIAPPRPVAATRRAAPGDLTVRENEFASAGG
jgi:hypothetical protein